MLQQLRDFLSIIEAFSLTVHVLLGPVLCISLTLSHHPILCVYVLIC